MSVHSTRTRKKKQGCIALQWLVCVSNKQKQPRCALVGGMHGHSAIPFAQVARMNFTRNIQTERTLRIVLAEDAEVSENRSLARSSQTNLRAQKSLDWLKPCAHHGKLSSCQTQAATGAKKKKENDDHTPSQLVSGLLVFSLLAT